MSETFDLEAALTDTGIPDDAQLTFNGKTVTFGNLRGLSKRQQTALQTKIDAASRKEQEVSTQQQQLLRLTQEAQQIHERLQTQEANRPTVAAADDDAYDTDPFYKPIRERSSKLEKRLDEISGQQKQLMDSLKTSITTWAEDRWDREYDGISFPKGKDKPKRDELIDFATKNRLVDRHGMPSVRKAWDTMHAGDRQKEVEDAAYARGQKDGEERARIASMPQPTTISPGGGKANGGAALSDLDDLTRAALADPELRQIIANTNLGVS